MTILIYKASNSFIHLYILFGLSESYKKTLFAYLIPEIIKVNVTEKNGESECYGKKLYFMRFWP